ncbi:phytoene desaturase [Streptomyces sp. NP160]|uniref:phytoene desaturase family protein n=1 Tax=Streptomyces sp. NP160 TaxID=2586637 RepID=UPI00111A4E57|nr:phytoene desaturase family protein [Streptomyces sp. NP160]TNM63234.1 phytoene desaturase [Streptomyces sp. NP160]
MARVIVVGAGLGGLAAAARLAASGHDVTVCEQAGTVGGKLGWYERDGFAFDTGPSLLTWPDQLRRLFAATGAPLGASLDLRPVAPTDHRFTDGSRLHLTDDLGPGWRRLLDRARRIWDATEGPFLSRPLHGPRTLAQLAARPGGLRDVATIAPGTSLRALARAHLDDPRHVALVDRMATYTGSDPRRAPAALASVLHLELTGGSWYTPGGLRRVVDAVADRARERGVRVLTQTRVEEVLVHAGRAAGVRLAGGRRLPADVVVVNADAAALYGVRTPPGQHPLLPAATATAPTRGARAGLAATTPSLSGFVLLLALRGRTPDLAHHTVLFPPLDGAGYDDEFDAVFGSGRRRGRPSAVPEPAVYVSAPDDPALRPDDGSEAWFVLVNAPRHAPHDVRAGVDWRAPGFAEAYADHVLAVMARRGLDVRDRVLWRQVRTPADLEVATGAVGGSIYGSSSNGARAAFLRPANRSGVPGLLLVGGSSHPGGGIPLVLASAAIAAGLVGPV